MEKRGFCVTASAALVAQHSMVPEVGKERPDKHDRDEILDFAKKVLEKIEKGIENTIKVPGNYPYKERMDMPVTPVCMATCNRCGTCIAACPMQAIENNADEVITSAKKCILCMKCTVVCPNQARILPPPLQEKMNQMLDALKTVHRENEYFL